MNSFHSIISRQTKTFARVLKCLSSNPNPSRVGVNGLNHQQRPYSIKAAELDKPREVVQVEFSDGRRHEFPWLFLQDNCTCPACYHPPSVSRLRKLFDLDLSNEISSVEPLPDNSAIRCRWKDGHEGVFPEKWLKERRFEEDNIYERKTTLRDEPELGGAHAEFSRDTFDNVMSNDKSLLNMIETVGKKGFFLLEGAPMEVGQVEKLANKIGFMRLTHYGYFYTVRPVDNANNLAYTPVRLGVHTDLPYYAYPPGVQMLHIIKQFTGGEGGESHFVDGFLVAEQMKQNYPEQYKILCETPLEFTNIGTDYTDFFKVHHSPTFVRHPVKKDKLIRVAYNNQVLSSYLPIKMNTVRPLYEALKVFTDLCYKPENLMQFKLKDGEVIVFDNWRMLHGRAAFDSAQGGRHLEGCYLDWDEVFNKANVIKSTMSQ